MNVLTAALLGLIQGLAEFLPISSSGHLNLLQALFGVDVEHQLLFNILLHVGTLVAVAIVFWKDWVAMIAHPIKNHTLVLLFIASLPALAGKILFDKPLDYVETHNSLLGVCFLITALLLVLTQWLSRRNALRGVEKHRVGVGEALAMGCLQAVGMLPGVSRSGSTIFGGVAARLDRETAAKFSFMMSAPAIVGGLVSEGMDVLKEGVNIGPDLPAILVGMAVAGVSGYLAIRFFLRLISRVSLNGFAIYVAGAGHSGHHFAGHGRHHRRARPRGGGCGGGKGGFGAVGGRLRQQVQKISGGRPHGPPPLRCQTVDKPFPGGLEGRSSATSIFAAAAGRVRRSFRLTPSGRFATFGRQQPTGLALPSVPSKVYSYRPASPGGRGVCALGRKHSLHVSPAAPKAQGKRANPGEKGR